MNARRLAPLLAVVVLVGCGDSGGGDTEDVEDVEVSGIPQAWLDETAEQWPDSSGFDAGITSLDADGSCVTFEEGTTIAGAEPTTTGVGFGRLSFSSSDDDYLYVCRIWGRGRYSGDVQLLQVSDLATAQAVASSLADDTDLPVQENDVSVVEVAGLEISVLSRWYPTNPQGLRRAVLVDEDRSAVVSLEVNSLDEDDFAAYTDQDVAEDLVRVLARG